MDSIGTLLLVTQGLLAAMVAHVYYRQRTPKQVPECLERSIAVLTENQTQIANLLDRTADRHVHMSNLLVGLTNQVLALTQDNVQRNSVIPPKG